MVKKYLLLFLPFLLQAEDLKQLVELSLQNQLIVSSEQSVESLKEEYKSTKSNYMPQVTLGSSYTTTNKETPTVADSSIISYANINYTVYDGGKKSALYDSYESNIKSRVSSLNSLKNRVSLDVINQYYKYLSLSAVKEATQKHIDQLNAQNKRLKKFFDVGVATRDEIDKIQSRVEIEYLNLHQIELNLQTILHNLEYITSKKVYIEEGSSVKKLELQNVQDRDDIKALEAQMKSALWNAKAVKSAYLPFVNFENRYNLYDMNYTNQLYDNNIEEQNIFKVNLAWKIFDFGATKNSYNSAYKTYKSLESRYHYEKSKADTDLRLALKSYEIVKLQIKTSHAALKAASSTYENIEAKYQNGLVDNIAYLEALSEKYNAISGVKSAKYDLEVKKANLIYYSGKNLWEYIQ